MNLTAETTMSAHTPGPWTASIVTVDAGGIKIRQDGYRGGASCASANRYEQMRQANAHLIAAAPEMLFALSQIIDDLPINRNWLNPDLESAAKAAIAKATGKDQAQ